MKDYTCYHISNKPELFPILQECMKPESVHFHDGTNIESFSKLLNTCVEKCPTETVIMMSDKVRPNVDHLYKLLKLLEDGYAFVGMYRFAFFGFKKELFRQIGPMDEGFIGGSYEDDDYYFRLKEANLAAYLSHEVPYQGAKSGWKSEHALNYFIKKWRPKHFPDYKKVVRQFPENPHSYNFGTATGAKFLSWQYTQIIPPKIHKYLHIKIGKV